MFERVDREPSVAPAAPNDWRALDPGQVQQRRQCDESGLHDAEVRRRRALHGPKRRCGRDALPAERPPC